MFILRYMGGQFGWTLVWMACICEVMWLLAFHYSENFRKVGWSALMIVTLIGSFLLLMGGVLMSRGVPLGTAYAVWTGVGTASAVMIGVFFGEESVSLWRLTFLLLIVIGVVGVHWING